MNVRRRRMNEWTCIACFVRNSVRVSGKKVKRCYNCGKQYVVSVKRRFDKKLEVLYAQESNS